MLFSHQMIDALSVDELRPQSLAYCVQPVLLPLRDTRDWGCCTCGSCRNRLPPLRLARAGGPSERLVLRLLQGDSGRWGPSGGPCQLVGWLGRHCRWGSLGFSDSFPLDRWRCRRLCVDSLCRLGARCFTSPGRRCRSRGVTIGGGGRGHGGLWHRVSSSSLSDVLSCC